MPELRFDFASSNYSWITKKILMLRDTRRNIWLSISHEGRADVVERAARRNKQKGLKQYIYFCLRSFAHLVKKVNTTDLRSVPIGYWFKSSNAHRNFMRMMNYRKKQNKVRKIWILIRLKRRQEKTGGASIQKFRLGYSPRYYGKRVVNRRGSPETRSRQRDSFGFAGGFNIGLMTGSKLVIIPAQEATIPTVWRDPSMLWEKAQAEGNGWRDFEPDIEPDTPSDPLIYYTEKVSRLTASLPASMALKTRIPASAALSDSNIQSILIPNDSLVIV